MASQSCQACQTRMIQQQICPCNLKKPSFNNRNLSEEGMSGISIGVPVQATYSQASNRDLSGSREIVNRMLTNFQPGRSQK